jgi:hypothetical protein
VEVRTAERRDDGDEREQDEDEALDRRPGGRREDAAGDGDGDDGRDDLVERRGDGVRRRVAVLGTPRATTQRNPPGRPRRRMSPVAPRPTRRLTTAVAASPMTAPPRRPNTRTRRNARRTATANAPGMRSQPAAGSAATSPATIAGSTRPGTRATGSTGRAPARPRSTARSSRTTSARARTRTAKAAGPASSAPSATTVSPEATATLTMGSGV